MRYNRRMKTVWLVRHGERLDFNEKCEWHAEWPERAKALGMDPAAMDHADVPLTPDGVIQAKHAAPIVGAPIKRVYSSPFLRCTQTADEIAAFHRVGVSVSTDLTEWMNPEWFAACYAHFDKIHFRNNRACFAPGYPVIPESEELFKERWARVFNALAEYPAENFPLAIVSHGGGIHRLLDMYNPAVMRGKGVQYADVQRMDL